MENELVKKYVFKSRRDIINDVEDILKNAGSELNFSEEKFINLQIAVSEALVNCIVHGNKEDVKKKVFVTLIQNKDSLQISVKDEGNGFDFEKLPDPTDESNLYKEHGRGIYIMKLLVDKFECKSDSGGTEFILAINK